MQFIKTVFTGLMLLSFLTSALVYADSKHELQTLVLDIYITGDSSVTGDKADNAHKINHFSQHFRDALQAKTQIDVINDQPINAAMAEVNIDANLHTCSKCDQNFAETVGAGLILKPNVFRMSHLISTLHIEIIEVKTGKMLKRKAYDFRGNTDKAWQRAIRYAVRDLENWQP